MMEKERKMSFSIIWLEWKGRWKKMGGWSFLPKPPFCPPSKLVRKEEKMAMRRKVQYYVHFTFFYFAPVWSLERKRRYEKEVWVVNITIWLIVQWGVGKVGGVSKESEEESKESFATTPSSGGEERRPANMPLVKVGGLELYLSLEYSSRCCDS